MRAHTHKPMDKLPGPFRETYSHSTKKNIPQSSSHLVCNNMMSKHSVPSFTNQTVKIHKIFTVSLPQADLCLFVL